MADTEQTKGIPVPPSTKGAPRMRAGEGWPTRDQRPEPGTPAPGTPQQS